MTYMDSLIRYLVDEIALNGSAGATPAEIASFVDIHRLKDGSSQGSQPLQSRVSGPDEPPQYNHEFLHDIWSWLLLHNDLSLKSPSGELEVDWKQAFDHNNHASSTERTSLFRILASVNRSWHALVGQSPESGFVQGLEFDCLSVIASRREHGIAQPDLVRVTGQDKKSLPIRTDRLAQKGLITKTPVLLPGMKTSHLVLARFNNKTTSPYDDTLNKVRNQLAGTQYQYIADKLLNVFQKLKSERILEWQDVLEHFSTTGNEQRKMTKFFRGLERIDCVRRERRTSNPHSLIKSLILLKDPSDDDWTRLLSWHSDQTRSQWQTFETSELETQDADDRSSDEEVEVGEDEVQKTNYRWNPYLPLVNMITDCAHSRGGSGASQQDLKDELVGDFYNRPFEITLDKLSVPWQIAQPPHLTHLGVLRDSYQVGRATLYNYYDRPSFQSMVDKGLKSWDHVVTVKTIKNEAQGLSDRAFTGFSEEGLRNIMNATWEPLSAPTMRVKPRKLHQSSQFLQASQTPQQNKKAVLELIEKGPKGRPRKYSVSMTEEQIQALPSKEQEKARISVRRARQYLKKLEIKDTVKKEDEDATTAAVEDSTPSKSKRPFRKTAKAAQPDYSDFSDTEVALDPAQNDEPTEEQNEIEDQSSARLLHEDQSADLDFSLDLDSTPVKKKPTSKRAKACALAKELASKDSPVKAEPIIVSRIGPSGGSLTAGRQDMIVKIVEKAGGVYSAERELWLAYATSWYYQGNGRRPDEKTVFRARDYAVNSGKLNKICFDYPTKRGTIATKYLLLLPTIDPRDQIVQDFQAQIKSLEPRLYLPPSVEIAEHFIRSVFKQSNIDERFENQDIANAPKSSIDAAEATDPRGENSATAVLDLLEDHLENNTNNPRKRARLPTLSRPQNKRRRIMPQSGPQEPTEKFDEAQISNAVPRFDQDIVTPRSLEKPVLTVHEQSTVVGTQPASGETIDQIEDPPVGPKRKRAKRTKTAASEETVNPLDVVVETLRTAQQSGVSQSGRPSVQNPREFSTTEVTNGSTIDQLETPLPSTQAIVEANPSTPSRKRKTPAGPRKGAKGKRGPDSESNANPVGYPRVPDSVADRDPVPTADSWQHNVLEARSSQHKTADGLGVSEGDGAAKRAVRRKFAPLSLQDEYDFYITITLVRMLTAGLGMDTIWSLCVRMLDSRFTADDLRSRWPRLRLKYNRSRDIILVTLQRRFLEVYEAGQLPSFSFDDLHGYQWPRLLQWARPLVTALFRTDDAADDVATKSSESAVYLPIDQWDYYGYRSKPSAEKREQIFIHTDFSTSRSSQQESSLPTAAQARKSWIRAAFTIPTNEYNEAAVNARLMHLLNEGALLFKDQLVGEKVLALHSKPVLADPRGHGLSAQFWARFRAPFDHTHFEQALQFVKLLVKRFETSDTYALAASPNDGQQMAILELTNAGHLKIAQVPKTLDPQLDPAQDERGELSDLGIELKQDVSLAKVLSSIPSIWNVPKGVLSSHGDENAISAYPIWVDFNGHVRKEIWQPALIFLISSLAHRPGASLSNICELLEPNLALWEVVLMSEWIVEAGLATWREKNSHLALDKLWWLRLGVYLSTTK